MVILLKHFYLGTFIFLLYPEAHQGGAMGALFRKIIFRGRYGMACARGPIIPKAQRFLCKSPLFFKKKKKKRPIIFSPPYIENDCSPCYIMLFFCGYNIMVVYSNGFPYTLTRGILHFQTPFFVLKHKLKSENQTLQHHWQDLFENTIYSFFINSQVFF